jgi:hypothetical protein
VWLNGSQVRDYAVEGLVDGNWQPLERAADAGGKMGDPPGSAGVKQVRLNIPVADENRRRHVLELRFHFPQRRPQRGPLSIEIPRLGRDVWVRRMYWQLVLPQNEHVVSSPEGFISEFTWGWNGYSWGRKALMKQSELEAWVGARRLDPLPEGTNRYLFSSFGNVGRCELRSAGRSWIVLGASGAALVGGLLLIYVPLARRLGTLFGAGVVLLCVGMVYPEPTLLLSQAASLGLALALLAGLLERTVARRRRGVTPPEPASAILEEGSTKTQYQPPLAADEVPAPAAPSLEPPSSPDSNP